MNKKNYNNRVMLSEEKLIYEGYCREHSSLSYVDSDRVKALKGSMKDINKNNARISKFPSEVALIQNLNTSNVHSELLCLHLTDEEFNQ
ncbi:hypothetical protein KXJ74_17760 (plasmid) [Acinetobacter johnsonii]|uniref:hypothetical protein n=1 Tax=Acinetobacter sp. YH01021 TaxID=2601035 RepID=UPI0015D11CFE|nr:hypothetical protein [Acinetobacter sp. YH01021]QXW27656.1 hypothetical protein KXJ74_17760 [Acinetobacter johnsonii]